MRWLLVLGLVALRTPADACPVGSECTKYKKLQKPLTLPVKFYTRAAAGVVPTFSEARVAKFLSAAVWQPVVDPERVSGTQRYTKPPKLKFLDPARLKTTPANKPDQRVVLLGRLAKRDGMILVDVEGEVHVLEPCAKNKRSACLTPRPELPFDPPDESDQERQKREEREQLIRDQRVLTKGVK